MPMAHSARRLDRAAFFWRSAVVFFVAGRFWSGCWIARAPSPPLRCRCGFSSCCSLAVATHRSVVFAVDGGRGGHTSLRSWPLRLVDRAPDQCWLIPPLVDDSAAISSSSPPANGSWHVLARRRQASLGALEPWQPDSTNRRLWFFPDAWDAEPWSVGLMRSIATSGSSLTGGLALGFLTGLPDRLAVPATEDPERLCRAPTPSRCRLVRCPTEPRDPVLAVDPRTSEGASRCRCRSRWWSPTSSRRRRSNPPSSTTSRGSCWQGAAMNPELIRYARRGRRDHALPRHLEPRRSHLRGRAQMPVRRPRRGRLQQRRRRGGDPPRRDRLQRARLRHRRGGRPRDHVPAGPRPAA